MNNPAKEEFILCQNFYACQHELAQLIAADENSTQIIETYKMNMESQSLSNATDYPQLRDTNKLNPEARYLSNQRLDFIHMGLKCLYKIESDVLMDKLILCLNWVSALTNQRKRYTDIKCIPIKYKFPINNADSPLFQPWNYLNNVLASEYHAIIKLFDDINMQYVSCAECKEHLTEMNMVKDMFTNVLAEFQSFGECEILHMDRVRLQLKKDDVVFLTEFTAKLISIIRILITNIWAIGIIVKKIQKSNFQCITMPFRYGTPKKRQLNNIGS